MAYTCCETAVKHALILQKVKNAISLNPTDMSEEVVWAAGDISAEKRTSSCLFSIFLQTILHTTHFSVRYSFALQFGHPRQQSFCVGGGVGPPTKDPYSSCRPILVCFSSHYTSRILAAWTLFAPSDCVPHSPFFLTQYPLHTSPFLTVPQTTTSCARSFLVSSPAPVRLSVHGESENINLPQPNTMRRPSPRFVPVHFLLYHFPTHTPLA